MCRATFDRSRPCYEHNGKLYCERDYNVVKKRIMCSGWYIYIHTLTCKSDHVTQSKRILPVTDLSPPM